MNPPVDWKTRALEAESRILELESLLQQYEDKLRLARLITWRESDEGPSETLASPRAMPNPDPQIPFEPKHKGE